MGDVTPSPGSHEAASGTGEMRAGRLLLDLECLQQCHAPGTSTPHNNLGLHRALRRMLLSMLDEQGYSEPVPARASDPLSGGQISDRSAHPGHLANDAARISQGPHLKPVA